MVSQLSQPPSSPNHFPATEYAGYVGIPYRNPVRETLLVKIVPGLVLAKSNRVSVDEPFSEHPYRLSSRHRGFRFRFLEAFRMVSLQVFFQIPRGPRPTDQGSAKEASCPLSPDPFSGIDRDLKIRPYPWIKISVRGKGTPDVELIWRFHCKLSPSSPSCGILQKR